MQNLKSTKRVPVFATIFLSLAIPFLLISNNGFPFTGLAISFVLLVGTGIYFKGKLNIWNWLTLGTTILLSSFLVLRANTLLLFLNLGSLLFLLCLTILPNNYLRYFWNLIIAPFEALGKVIQSENKYPLELSSAKESVQGKINLSKNLVISIIITIVILAILIPLLAASNPIFAAKIDEIAKLLDISKFFENFFSTGTIIWLARIVLALILLYLVPKAISYIKENVAWEKHTKLLSQNLSLLIPKVAVIILFIVFFITQAQLYFATPETLTALGYSNSQATREVFAHLLIVCLIVFTLIYNDRTETKANRWTTLILLFGVFVMNLMAFKSDFDYTSLFGFTEKRLYGFAINFWIFGALGIYLYNFLKNNFDNLVKELFYWALGVLILINLANFDYLIYNVNPARTGEGIDHEYLLGLSEDSESYLDQLEKVNKDIGYYKYGGRFGGTYKIFGFLEDIETLRERFKTNSFQSFNLSLWTTYNQTRPFDVQGLKNKLNNTTPAPTNLPSQTTSNQITIKLRNIDPRFRNKRFSAMLSGNSELARQDSTLTDDSFIHTMGSGEYSLVIWLDDQQQNNFTPTRTLSYTVPEGFTGNTIDIDFSKF